MTAPDRVFLQMWGPTREHLIANHQFYVSQARSRLLDQFDEEAMKADAQRHADEWLEKRSRFFDPERDDPSAAHEAAFDEHISFYLSLAGLRDSTRLSIIAGMFHEWEKQVRDWLGTELGHHGFRAHVHAAVWSVKVDDLFELFAKCSWSVRDEGFFPQLQRCQLVANVYKHGNGPSFDTLKKLAPELVGGKDHPAFFVSALDYSALEVSDDNLASFAEAITAFWRALPENIFFSEVNDLPNWLDKALRKEARP